MYRLFLMVCTHKMYIVHTPDYTHFTLRDAVTGHVKNSANAEFETKEGPTFTDARLFAGILHGDTVTIYDDRDPAIELMSRAKHPALAGVLEMASKTLYGMTSRNVPIYLFRPFDRRYPPFRVGCSERDRSTNRLAIIQFEDWAKGYTLPRGALVQLLGRAGDFKAERLALQQTASPFWSHKAFMGHASYIEPPRRQLLDAAGGWTLLNVDPAGCRDIDDVIGFRGDQVAICIADVDEVVHHGTSLDHYASLTAQTIYDGGEAVRPMLPPALSEGICSLQPGELRPTVALMATIRDGGLANVHFKAVNIINGRSYTYEEAPADLFKPLMAALGCDSADSHEWIAAAMKFYNLEAAARLGGRGILRTHSGPKAERLAALTAALGPEVAARFASEAAAYAPSGTHFGMGDRPYCHATSPIRRYADLVNQRILKGCSSGPPDWQLFHNLNVRSKAAKEYERAVAFMKALKAPVKEVDVIVIDEKTAYVPSWNRMIRLKGASPGPQRVRYFYDASKAQWKERMVFEIINT
jgi:exoribonuclease R